jgi:hypothetical protein
MFKPEKRSRSNAIALKAGRQVIGILKFPFVQAEISELFFRHNGWKGALVNNNLKRAA